jgi:hypothetical protein
LENLYADFEQPEYRALDSTVVMLGRERILVQEKTNALVNHDKHATIVSLRKTCIFVLLLLLMSKQIDDTQTVHINAWEEETKVEVLQCEPGEATFLSRGEKCGPCDHSLLAKGQGCKQKPVSIRLQSTYTVVLARLQRDSLTYYS